MKRRVLSATFSIITYIFNSLLFKLVRQTDVSVISSKCDYILEISLQLHPGIFLEEQV